MDEEIVQYVNRLAIEGHITREQHQVMYALARRMTLHDWVIPEMAYPNLSGIFGMKPRAIQGTVGSLIKKGLLSVTALPGQRRGEDNLYRWEIIRVDVWESQPLATPVVYVLADQRESRYLIGKTLNMDTLLLRTRVLLGVSLKVVASHQTENAWKLLRQLRREFQDKKESGNNWYRLTEEDIERVKNLKP